MTTRRSFMKWLAGASFSCIFPSLLISDALLDDGFGRGVGRENVWLIDFPSWQEDRQYAGIDETMLAGLMADAKKNMDWRPPLRFPI